MRILWKSIIKLILCGVLALSQIRILYIYIASQNNFPSVIYYQYSIYVTIIIQIMIKYTDSISAAPITKIQLQYFRKNPENAICANLIHFSKFVFNVHHYFIQ